ncbi:type II toxin-antitoxin system HigA family antitoxin [Nostoc sp. PCC 7107]|uniref:helix-turn-helix domain-containing protein n=1 Tax=Nostoc sp. PCC 7107 TaxID=317936 RepID=UPI00029F0889|nr:transcriptional regulator [Nostoc sp. PCC 7107]AFY44939.1 putative transcription regulator with HTH domain [Nostoc sp. PCC 7107]
MNLTFNPENYALLLAKYQSKVITNDAENEQAIIIAQELAHRTNRTSEESALYDLLIALIEKYENETYPMGETTPLSMLLHLIEARNFKPTDLIGVIGSSIVVSEIINGKQQISKAQAKALGEFFQIDAELFID